MRPAGQYTDLLRDLAQPGCVGCRRAAWSEDRFVSAFVHEAYTDAQLRKRLRVSLGFCAEHARRLLATTQAPWVMGTVYADIFAEACERWDAGRGRGPAACPMCESRDGVVDTVLRLLTTALRESRVWRAFAANGGLCVAHARRALRWSGPIATARIVERLERAVTSVAPPCEALIGPDRDRELRAIPRSTLKQLAASAASGEARTEPQRLLAQLQVEACVACLTRGLAEEQALRWLESESALEIDALAADGVQLCGVHLNDAFGDDKDAATRLAALTQRQLTREVTWLRLRLSLRGLRKLEASRATRAFSKAPRCFVCAAGEPAAAREIALLRAALENAAIARRFESSHGVCLHHARELVTSAALGVRAGCASVTELVQRETSARLAIMRWELDELRRQADWRARHEVRHGNEMTWLRAPALLDGRVFLGAPAVPLSATR